MHYCHETHIASNPRVSTSIAAKKIGQTILVTHHGLGEEEAANIIKVDIGEDGSSTVSRG